MSNNRTGSNDRLVDQALQPAWGMKVSAAAADSLLLLQDEIGTRHESCLNDLICQQQLRGRIIGGNGFLCATFNLTA